MIALTIDGRPIEAHEGRTILQVAREHGIEIPTLCYHEALEPFGACRLCMVEVEAGRGRQLVAACSYPVSDGLAVYTRSEVVLRSRRMTVELFLATGRNVPLIRRLADELGVGEPRFLLPEDDCILCGLCVRACRELVGLAAISAVNRGSGKRISPPFERASNACIRCGTCVLVCPTGAMTLADVCGQAPAGHPVSSEFAAAACRVCDSRYGERRFVDAAELLPQAQPAPAAQEEAAR